MITLEHLPDVSFKVNLYVLEESTLDVDVVIGWELLEENKLSVLYQPSVTGSQFSQYVCFFRRLTAGRL